LAFASIAQAAPQDPRPYQSDIANSYHGRASNDKGSYTGNSASQSDKRCRPSNKDCGELHQNAPQVYQETQPMTQQQSSAHSLGTSTSDMPMMNSEDRPENSVTAWPARESQQEMSSESKSDMRPVRRTTTTTTTSQVTTSSDLELTRRIRRELMGSNLSAGAKNVTITSSNGVVRLQGQVTTPQERQTLLNIASSVAGNGNVQDQLVVQR
ncbi:MAG: BON domain-containing protein, partial [Proteobacteria bacterium]|nr:BON domain-containing protein [Pseudomonadota bacterium]